MPVAMWYLLPFGVMDRIGVINGKTACTLGLQDGETGLEIGLSIYLKGVDVAVPMHQ